MFELKRRFSLIRKEILLVYPAIEVLLLLKLCIDTEKLWFMLIRWGLNIDEECSSSPFKFVGKLLIGVSCLNWEYVFSDIRKSKVKYSIAFLIGVISY